MKWFKHLTDSHANGKMRQILRKHGLEGYAFCWICRELIGKEGNGKYRISSEKDWKLTLKDISGLEEEKINSYLSYQAEIGAIDHKALEKGDLYIPKLKEYGDEYSTRISRHTPDNVRVDKIRIDKIRLEYIKTKGFRIEDFSSDDFNRTAKAIKTLLIKSNLKDDLVVKSFKWAGQKEWCDWTLETIVRKWADFIKEQGQVRVEPKPKPDCDVCGGSGYVDQQGQKAKCFCW